MFVTRSQSAINKKQLVQKKNLNNNLNDVIQEDNHDHVNDKEYIPDEENEDYDEDYEDYDEDYDEDFEQHEEYLREKEKACADIKKLLNDFATLNQEKKIRFQSEQYDEPEYINILFELFNNIKEKDKYIMYKGEEKFNRLYQVSQNKLYEFITSIFLNYKRPDLSYKLYYNFKDYFNLDFDDCFINI